jgi:hypothetical protein
MSKIFENNALKYYEMGYNVLPVEPNSKAVLMESWQNYCEKKQMGWQVESWLSSFANHNIGIPLGAASDIIALDFDIDINNLHEKVQELLEGSLVKKKGQKGFTAFYKYNGEITKRWRYENKCVVELLSSGTYTVMPPSIHPDTKQPYVWVTPDTLLDLNSSELTTLPVDFIKNVDELFGYKEKIINFNDKYDGELPELSEIEKALSFIPSMDYATWITIGMALQHNYGDAAYNAWDAWSRKAPNYTEKGMQYKWNSFGKYSGNPVSIGTIYHSAVGYGYIIKHEPEFIIPADFKLIANGIDLMTGKKEIVDKILILENDDINELEFPKHLLDNAPGLPGEIAAWINSTSRQRQPILALGAGICASGTIMAHRVKSDSNLRTNFMALGLAESSTGKNHARNCIKSLFFNANLENLTIGKAASDTGLINRLYDNNSVGIALMDEIGREMQSLTSKGAGSHESRLLTLLMEIYSEAGTYYDGKCYANAENSKKLIQPLLNIYATSVPKRFFDSMTSDEAIDGFLARWLIFQSHDIDPPLQEHANIDNIPKDLMDNVMYIRNMPIYAPVNHTAGNNFAVQTPIPQPKVIHYTGGAEDILREFSEACNKKRIAEIKRGGLLAPIWGRSREHAIKLALVAHPYRYSVIDSVTMQWACEVAMHLSHVAIKAIGDNVADTEHEKLLNKVRNVIKRWCDRNKGQYLNHHQLCNLVRFIKGRERNEILQQLYESGMIDVKEVKNPNGKISNSYKSL